MEQCKFCQREVIDDSGSRTDDYGTIRYGKYICSKCLKAFEFSLGD